LNGFLADRHININNFGICQQFCTRSDKYLYRLTFYRSFPTLKSEYLSRIMANEH
jgi:hypothetical protein